MSTFEHSAGTAITAVARTKRSGGRAFRRLATLALAGALLGVLPPAQAQPAAQVDFEGLSLQFRTALHYDPLLPQQLDGLVKLYSDADRVDELIGLYRAHIEEYPDDAGAKTVLIRVLRKTNRPGAGELVVAAVPSHPEFAPLHYLLYQFLREKGDARSIDSLSTAIDLQENPSRKWEWLEELLQLSESDEARARAAQQIQQLLDLEGGTADQYMELGRLTHRYDFWDLSLRALEEARDAGLTPEASIEAGVLEAKSLGSLGEGGKAAETLDSLLGRLAPDHWRRREIMNLRYSVLADAEERAELIARYEKAFREDPGSETALIDLLELLLASEQQTRAAELLVEVADQLAASQLVENRALEILDSINDPRALESFLSDRLEIDPGRTDLRFRLVKALYGMRRDGDAEQEFQAVVAGLEQEEVGERVLELQRYLREIERIEAAGVYLRRYVADNPERLSVARELAEIYVALERRDEVPPLVATLDSEAASIEELVDLVEFLSREEFFVPAKGLLTDRFESTGEEFELGLLLISVLGDLGDADQAAEVISRMRELAASPERYGRWLETSVAAHRKLETLERFFDSERERFTFDDGEWPEDKVEKFVRLCELGRSQAMASQVTDAVRQRLASGGIESRLRVRLRRFLVDVLGSDPSAGPEVLEQLERLVVEDPGNRIEYDLRRALVYHRSQLITQAQELLLGIDLSEVQDVTLVQEAAEVLIGYGFLEEAITALEAVNRLAPADLFSWEKRLTLLALLRRESDFRALLRQIRGTEIGESLRTDSIGSLDRHLVASHWRSASRLFSSRDPRQFEEILPILASVDRESGSPLDATWTEWTRALVLRSLGREEESNAARERLERLLAEMSKDHVEFPDGIRMSLDGATRLLEGSRTPAEASPDSDSDFLFSDPQLRWAFEIDPGAVIESMAVTAESVLVLDNRGMIYSVDATSGKLIWETPAGASKVRPSTDRPFLFHDLPGSDFARAGSSSRESRVKLSPRLVISGQDRVAVVSGDSVSALRTSSGQLEWTHRVARPEGSQEDGGRGADADLHLRSDGERLHLFDPETGRVSSLDGVTGKLLWETDLVAPGDELEGGRSVFSLNSGIDSADGMIFVYGLQSALLDAETGALLWSLSEASPVTFPVELRRERGESVEEEASLVPATVGRARLVDYLGADSTQSEWGGTALGESTSLVTPALFWSESRLHGETGAHAVLSGGHLWLMRDGGVRQVSVRFPVASRTLSASGAYLGQQGSHVWFLDGDSLVHLDFEHGTSDRVRVTGVGQGESRAAFSGNRILLRGNDGFVGVNSRTGTVVGRAPFPEELTEYLALRLPEAREDGRSGYHWQGRSFAAEDGSPVYCRPVHDILRDGAYFTQFGDGIVVCLAARPSSEPASEDSQAAAR